MRLYPPCPFLARYCSEDTTIGENISVEEGTVVMWFNTYFHMHPDLYDNPKGMSYSTKDHPLSVFGTSWSSLERLTVLWPMVAHFRPDPNSWKDFDPSRWEGNESNTLQDDFWFGFGHGPRACPGTRWAYLTMKMIIIEVIKQYKIIECEKTPKNIKMTLTDLKLTSDKPMIIKFQNR